MGNFKEFDPSQIERREIYRILTGSIVPRPIGWASTISKDGISNIAPFSFFTCVCVAPPMISLTIARNPDGSKKHTLINAEETGDFCFNLVSENLWEKMVDTANGYEKGISEFSEVGIESIPSIKVDSPRVKQSPIHFECKTHKVIELGPNKHPLLIGEVVYFHVSEEVLKGKYIDMEKLKPVGRLNGFLQCSLGEFLERSFQDGQKR
tara:strand:- start:1025 stop:1648 length:624 start_codon:yes stop_codon:yes gene_type:complete